MKLSRTSLARFGGAALAIAACLLLMQAAARFGFSRLLARYALASNSLPAADQAVQLAPNDANAHRARATVLNRLNLHAAAEESLERATRLRSHDDILWLELGNTREELGDNEGALAAYDQAVRWAPYYAHTHWRRGNLELRMGRYDEAFVELRQAAASKRDLLPNLIDLAWGLTRGDVNATERLLQLNNDTDRLVFFRFLAQQGKGSEIIGRIGLLTAPLSMENREELVRLLFAAKAFGEAFLLKEGSFRQSAFLDGGFEEALVLNHAGFGWIIGHGESKTRLALDVAEKSSGGKSLQVAFEGEWGPGIPLLSQTIVVEPGQRYRISFALKTKDLVTGGPPLIFVNDALSEQALGQSEPFLQSTNSWQRMNIDVTTLPTSQAIVVRLQRQSCPSTPCPIFGVAWLDDFSIQKL